MELQGPSLSSASKKIKQSSVEDMEAREEYQDAGQQSAEDSVRMDQTVMSRKKRSLYMAMQVMSISLSMMHVLFLNKFLVLYIFLIYIMSSFHSKN